jgi:hypothetical protein
MPSGGRIYRQAALQFSVRGSAANLQSRCGRRVPTLLPIARRPTPFTDRIVLALELAGLCAAEVALPLKVIDTDGVLPIRAYRRGRTCLGGSRHMVWVKAPHGASEARKRTPAMEVRNRFKLTDHEVPWQGSTMAGRRGGAG